jgi:phospholipid/cholesterol/gamma-HCH transport system permease protein
VFDFSRRDPAIQNDNLPFNATVLPLARPVMNQEASTVPWLKIDRTAGGVVRVGLAGDWTKGRDLPQFDAIEKDLAAGTSVTAATFDTTGLGRWDSTLVTFLFRCYELCEKNRIDFRVDTLPAGLAKLLRLTAAVPEKKDAVRVTKTPSFLQRLGESGVASFEGATGMLTFLGQNVLALMKLVRGHAQFRWSDTWLAIQECGPEA